MGQSTIPRHTALVSWQGILLTASLLTFWNVPTTAQLTIEAVPPNAAEGQDVLLRVHNPGANLQGYLWFRGDRVNADQQIVRYLISSSTTVPGPAHSGRETIFSNGSLLIRNLTQNDTGVYTLQIITADLGGTTASVEIQVHQQLSKPNISSNNSDPVEGETSVALMCGPNIANTIYHWRVHGQNLTDDARLQLSEDNRTLIIYNVTRNDTGPYECEIWNPVSANRSDPFTLNVLYGPEDPTISPSESYFQAGTNLNLSCHAVSNPPAQYSWLINGIPQPSSPDLFIPNITTNNSGVYSCFVNNSYTGLSRITVKNVTVFEPVTQPSIEVTNTTVEEKDSVVFTCLSNDTDVSIRWIFKDEPLQLTDRTKLSRNNTVLTIDPVWREDIGDYQCEVSNLVSSSKSERIRLAVISFDPVSNSPTPPSTAQPPESTTQLSTSTEVQPSGSPYDPTTSNNPGLSGGAIAGIVVGSVAGVALIVALAYFLYFRKTGRASDEHHLTEHKLSTSKHCQGPFENPLSKVDEISYSSLTFNTQQPRPPTSASQIPKASETVYSEVIKK